MDDRSSTSKPTASSPSHSTTPDIKSPTTRPTYSSKLSDHKSRAAEATSSSAAARQPPVQQQRAWTSNKNPITGRSHTPQGGLNSQNKQPAFPSFREGQSAENTPAPGEVLEGTKPSNSAEPNGAGRREQRTTMSSQRKDITAAARGAPGNAGKGDGKGMNGNRSGFKTDSSISNSRQGGERELKRWVPDSNENTDFSLEESGGRAWNQFDANEKLYNVKSDYDESLYTTSINKAHPDYQKRVAFAERKAREIERSAPVTAHVAEERVMDHQGGADDRDEEEKYSGVRRQDFPPLTNRENKYTPPARRAPTGHTTVKGAPVDPAIISAQLKATPTPKPAIPKIEETKTQVPANKGPAPAAGPTPEVKTKDTNANESKSDKSNASATDTKTADKTSTVQRSSATTSGTGTPKEDATPVLATQGVEQRVLTQFRHFATRERQSDKERQKSKAAKDKEAKLAELKSFAQSFKLSTPVPTDLISIIAKDPEKQRAIQEKALHNAAEEITRKKAELAQKEKEVPVPSSQAKPAAEQPANPTTTSAPVPEPRNGPRPTAPQHANSQTGIPNNRHQNQRAAYNNNQYAFSRNNNRPPPHLAQQGQQTGNLAQRIRSNLDQQKAPVQHMGPHAGPQDMRLPPTGPANNVDTYGRRVSGIQHLNFNPRIQEFRPNAFAPAFVMPAAGAPGPSQGSSPRTSVNNMVEPTIHPLPLPGQLLRKRTKAVSPAKCNIIRHIESLPAPAGPGPQASRWESNGGFMPAYDTPPTWRQSQDGQEKPDSTMNMTYKQYFEKLPIPSAAAATPNPSHAMPQLLPHQHQLPFHLQHGAQNMAQRHSPHMPPMPMHTPQHGHGPHAPFTSGEDHRMVHSNSAQSFASPRMGQVPMVYPPAMGTPGQMQYSQPVMQPYMNPGAPQMGQFRSFSNNPQFMPQQPHHMGTPMMVQQQFIPGPSGMMAAGPQVSMYPGHPQFMSPNTVPPQPMAATNGFPSPSRPAAPMMAHQGSHQGQPVSYGMSPGMPYQQTYQQQQSQGGKFSGPRPQ